MKGQADQNLQPAAENRLDTVSEKSNESGTAEVQAQDEQVLAPEGEQLEDGQVDHDGRDDQDERGDQDGRDDQQI